MLNENKSGCWLGTYTGKKFWPLNPNPEDVCLEDIAHALSNLCRFNGHSKEFYSVAEHCLNVEALLEGSGFNETMRFHGLLHDAAEAYICDIPRPFKKVLLQYEYIEFDVMNAIYKHFGLDYQKWVFSKEINEIKNADNYLLALEANTLMVNTSDWDIQKTNLTIKKTYGSIEELFIDKAKYLLEKVKQNG